MRLHTDKISESDVFAAARVARVSLDRFNNHGSRKRDRAFDITLQGESRRHQNGGDGMAATWDQWGVFLGFLFDIDPDMVCWAYENQSDFDYKTSYRFDDGWPSDAHGDHTFRFSGIPGMQVCTKCTAENRWR